MCFKNTTSSTSSHRSQSCQETSIAKTTNTRITQAKVYPNRPNNANAEVKKVPHTVAAKMGSQVLCSASYVLESPFYNLDQESHPSSLRAVPVPRSSKYSLTSTLYRGQKDDPRSPAISRKLYVQNAIRSEVLLLLLQATDGIHINMFPLAAIHLVLR